MSYHIGKNSDVVLNVEKLQYLDGSLDVNETLLESDLQKIYIAYFGRSADPDGCQYWENRVKEWMSEGDDYYAAMQKVIDAFTYSKEAESYYPGISSGDLDDASIEAFWVKVYQNLFDRVPDSGDLSYWKGVVADLQSQNKPIGYVVNKIIMGNR